MRVASSIVALTAMLAALPRPAFYAHHHAADRPGHLHALPVAAARAPHSHPALASHAHSHLGVSDHAHHHADEHDHAHPHEHPHVHGTGHHRHDVTAISVAETTDHWHFQQPFQPNTATAAIRLVPSESVVHASVPIATRPSTVARPVPQSRGPPATSPLH
jgi:hypothetical protein